MAARIAHVCAKVRTYMRTVADRNNPSLMDHFISDDDVPGRLHDLIPEVVYRREHARHEAARDAPAVDIEVFPGIDFFWEMLAWARSTSQALNKFLTGGSHRRNSPIRRLDYERGLSIRLLPLLPIRRRIDGHFTALREDFAVGCGLLLCLFLALRQFL